ncbi:L,D-transpeptidase family protein [Halomonas sp. THAF12]|uniref:L,D-transpeptidase family protein n=1 Tax=Halomonas sp. THAF12 TaxID=2587849 RepID=UPI00126862F4|nr:L,D-transpeptidase family protein [Halomonas sp. THAF12]
MTKMIPSPLRSTVARTTLLVGLTTALAAPLQASEDLPRGYYYLPEEGDLVGEVYTIEAEKEDTLIDIGHEHGIGYRAMVRANPDVSVWYPGEGTEVTIPGQFILPDVPRNDIVINVAEMRLYYYPPAEDGEPRIVQTYPLGVGRQDWETPLGNTTITQMVRNPAWYPPASIRREHAEAGDPLPSVVPAGPDNPLGTRKMRLGIPGYLIHGTNKPEGVGMRVSHGCVRMLPEDVETLFDQVSVGTQVRIINESFKLGWSDGTLYVQAYPYLDEKQGTTIQRVTEALDEVDASTEGLDYAVDYSRLREVVEVPGGMPVALETPPEPEPAPRFYEQLQLIAATDDADEDEASQG